MTLTIKLVHNLPPHLSYVSTLPDISPKRDIDELKQRIIDTWNSSGHHRRSHWSV